MAAEADDDPGALTGGRVLVTGAAGMLGSQCLLSAPEGFEAIGSDLREAPEGNPKVALVGHDLTCLLYTSPSPRDS